VTYDDGSFEQYEYDANGNITKITLSNGDTIEYTYDSFNRLIEEVNCAFGQRTIITYDKGGNITQKRVVSCQNATDQTIDYVYANAWKDQLTSYNGQAITYDEIGNPTSYKGNTLYWTRGRLLEAYGNKACYEYNSAGIRTEKCVKGVPTKYVVAGSQIISEKTSGVTTVYYYSTDGIIGFNREGVDYFYRKNLQGDIIAIVNTSGGIVAKYVYDAWGNHKIYSSANTLIYDSQNPSSANSSHIGCINPFRYRSYYFDSEIGLYYLNSRYYDPQIGRFLNADRIDYISPESIQGLNLYSYCLNNPIMYLDPFGNSIVDFFNSLFGTIILVAVSVAEIAIGVGMLFSGDIQRGTGLIGTGFASIISGFLSLDSNNNFFAGWTSAQVTGLGATFIPGVGAVLGAFAGSVANDWILNGWNSVDFGKAGINAFAVGMFSSTTYYLENASSLIVQTILVLRNLFVNMITSMVDLIYDRH